MHVLHEDLIAHLHNQQTIQSDLPDLGSGPSFPKDMLAVTYKLRDGTVLTENNIQVDREKMLEGVELAKERYGKPNLKNRLNSKDKHEVARAYFELASLVFAKDGYHIPLLHMLRDDNSGFMIQPNYRDRAEKILFFRQLADTVRDKKVDKIVLITESWHLFDPKRAYKQLSSGKELSALRKKEEGLDVLYLDKTGFIMLLSAPIIRNKEDKKVLPILGEVHQTQFEPEEYPAFAAVFHAWGLIEKITVERTYSGNPEATQD